MGADLELRYFNEMLEGVLKGATIPGIAQDDIAWPLKTYTPKKGIPYLRVQGSRTRTPVGFGANSVQEWRGTWQISVYGPRDNGERSQNLTVSAILRLYPRGLNLQTPQDIWMTVTRSTDIAAVEFNDWVNVPVQVDWFAHEPP